MWFKKNKKQKKNSKKRPGRLVFTIPSSESVRGDSRIDVTTGTERKTDISFKTLMTGMKHPVDEDELPDSV